MQHYYHVWNKLQLMQLLEEKYVPKLSGYINNAIFNSLKNDALTLLNQYLENQQHTVKLPEEVLKAILNIAVRMEIGMSKECPLYKDREQIWKALKQI